MWWAIPYGADATANNKIITWASGVWTPRAVSVPALGSYKPQTNYTWATLPYATWTAWDWESWNSAEGAKGYAIDIGSDSVGKTFSLHDSTVDDGSSYTGYFVLSTELTGNKALAHFKRILQMRLYFRGEVGGTVTVSVKRDHEAVWQIAGSVSLTATADTMTVDLPMDYRAKHLLVKFSATNKFRLLGAVFEWMPDGTD